MHATISQSHNLTTSQSHNLTTSHDRSPQFLDPFVVMYAVGRLDLCFLTAAKSMRQRLVGFFTRLVESITSDLSWRNSVKTNLVCSSM